MKVKLLSLVNGTFRKLCHKCHTCHTSRVEAHMDDEIVFTEEDIDQDADPGLDITLVIVEPWR